jgi:hypothetical protein
MDNQISVISQNVMADMYTLNHANDRYGHVKDKSILEWNYRYPLLIQKIINNDIICLQEVELKNIPTSKILMKELKNIELSTYKNCPLKTRELIKEKISSLKNEENDVFSPFLIPELEKPSSLFLNPNPISENFVNNLSDYDYVHRMICNVKTNICDKYTNPIGNMTLWNKTKFELVKFVLNSYGVFVKLKHINTNIEFLLVNIHLKAGRYVCIQDRNFQLNSCFKVCANICKNCKTCIVGDFNDGLESLSLNWNIINENKFIIAESYPTCDIYNHTDDIHNYYTFDHVIFYDVNITIGDEIELKPFPNENEPSDHLPLMFNINL